MASFSIKIRPADLPLSRRDEVVQRLAVLLGIDPAGINEAIDLNPGSNFDLVRIAQDVPETTARIVAESPDELPGVQVVVETRRAYSNGPLFSQVVGYTGPINADQLADRKDDGYLPDDLLGKAGLERRSRTSFGAPTAASSWSATPRVASSRSSRPCRTRSRVPRSS